MIRLLVLGIFAVLFAVACSSAASEQVTENNGEAAPLPVEEQVAQLGDFEQTSDMKASRERFAAIRLSDGRVLAAGGRGRGLGNVEVGNFEESTELLDPETVEWTFTGDMAAKRQSPAMVELNDGRVLVAGGLGQQKETISTAEIWDPATGVWVATSPLNLSRSGMGVTKLLDGRVMLVGGKTDDKFLVATLVKSEIYDPATATWFETAPMSEKRINHTTTLLADGRVLVVGGGKEDGPYLKTVEIYDPASDTWITVSPMKLSRSFHTATTLVDGRLLIVGGRGKRVIAEIYDPISDTWTEAGQTTAARAEHSAVLLLDGRVLVTGGLGSLNQSEIYDPETNEWSDTAVLNVGRYRHNSVLLKDGRVMVMGGNGKEGILVASEVLAFAGGSTAVASDRSGESQQPVGTPTPRPDATATPQPTPTPEPTPTPVVVVETLTFPASIQSDPGLVATHANLGQPVRLTVGQELNSPKGPGGLIMRYVTLVEDTRCPAGSSCDEPGQVVVRIALRILTGPLGESDMVIKDGQVGTTVKKFGRYSVAFLGLEPKPTAAGAASPEEATATLVIFQP